VGPSGEDADAGVGPTEPGNDAGPTVVNPLPGCVPVDRGEPQDSACPAPRIDIDPSIVGPVCAPGGFTIEGLQLPDFSNGVLADPANPPFTEPDPAKWDRSVLPAGAYVFRVHGLRASCYPAGGRFYTGPCSANLGNLHVLPASFYEQHCTEVPGCSTAEKIAFSGGTDGYDVSGYWWYLNDRGDSALDVVVCAPNVPSYASGGCLALDPELHCGK
jgi:hypothetical protein